MGKRFIKFRVFLAIPTFESCRSKDPSSLPTNPVPSFRRLSSARPPPDPKPLRSSLKRHVSSAFTSARRSFLGSRFFPEDHRTQLSPSSRFRWGKDPKWHVISNVPNLNDHSTPPRRKIYNSASSGNENDVVLFPPLPLNNRKARRRRGSFRKKIRISTSSDSGLFSDDEDERENDDDETDALVSTDSFTPKITANKTKKTKKKIKRRSFRLAEESPAPARLSEFMRRMACKEVEGKVRESFAVVKRSADPYEDFKRSMAEMVVGKQMFKAAELEELLRCFLSLNSAHHHEAIVRAFADIWEALFSQSTS